ncbi:hypothetical protein ACROYT_G007028 [Oculina patagonica]
MATLGTVVKYEDLVKILRDHYEPKPIVIAERFHFHKREQHEGEGVAAYSAALKKCSEHCAFGTFLQEALRDRFVCGLRSKQIQKRLLSEKKLTWKEPVEIALAMEVADKQANNFRNSPAEGNLHYVKPPHPPKMPKPRKPCFRCGENHVPQKCRFKDEFCRKCKSKGHITKVCKKDPPGSSGSYAHGSRPDRGSRSVRYVEDAAALKEPNGEFKLFQIHQEKPEPSIKVPVKVNGEQFSMELDTGASVSIMSEEAWKKNFPKIPLEESKMKLRTYTGEALEILGQARVEVTYQGQTANLPLQVIKGQGPSLFGRNWLRNIKLNWGSIKKISSDLDNVLTRHQSVFKDELGTMQGVKAKLFVKSESKPKFFKPRPVPYALKGAIEQELDRLESMGVIEKVRYSEWAAPIVPVVKPDNSIRVCGDYKVTVNSVLDVDQHPLPNPEELFVTLSGGEKYSKLDLSRAYQQILLDDDSREYVTINTHKVFDRQTDQKARHDKVSKEREFTLGEQVLVQNFRGEPKWLGGVITEQTGPVSYKVLVGDQLWKRHIDQMHQKHEDSLNGTTEVSVTPSNDAITQDVVDIQPVAPPQIETAKNATPEPSEIISSESRSNAATHATAIAQSQPQPRYPTRQRKALQRLGFDTK